MKITLLGTGTPAPLAHRAAAGYVVELDQETFVFDHGPGAHARMLQAGFDLTRVSQLFLTHLHYDHFADVPSLVLRRWDQGGGDIADLPVYAPAPAARRFELLFGADGVYHDDLEARTRHAMSLGVFHARGGAGERTRPNPQVHEIAHGDVVDGDGWRVRAVETPHAQPQLVTLAYRLDAGERSLVFTGDTGPCAALVDLARGADVMIHMCHYRSGTQLNDEMAHGCCGHIEAATHARDAGVGTLVLTHLTKQLETDGVRERVLHEVGTVFDGRVIWGEDLKVIVPGDGAEVAPV